MTNPENESSILHRFHSAQLIPLDNITSPISCKRQWHSVQISDDLRPSTSPTRRPRKRLSDGGKFGITSISTSDILALAKLLPSTRNILTRPEFLKSLHLDPSDTQKLRQELLSLKASSSTAATATSTQTKPKAAKPAPKSHHPHHRKSKLELLQEEEIALEAEEKAAKIGEIDSLLGLKHDDDDDGDGGDIPQKKGKGRGKKNITKKADRRVNNIVPEKTVEIQREDSNISLKRPTTTTTTTTSDPKDNTTYRSKIEEMDNILGLRQNYEPVQSGTTKRSKLSSTSQPRRSKRGHAHPGPEPLPQNSRDIESPDKQDCGKPSLTADIGTPEKPIDKYSRMSEMDRILFGGGDCHVTITNANNPEEEGKQEILESISDDSDEDDGHDVKDDDNDKTHDISRRKAQIDYLLGFQYHNNESTFPSSDVQDLEDDSDQEGTSINNTWSTARDRIDFEMGLLNHDRRAEMDRILGCLHSTQYY